MSNIYNTRQRSHRVALPNVDAFLHNLYSSRNGNKKLLTMGGSLVVYTVVILLFGQTLKISSNYFIIIPLIAIASSYGFWGGLIAGVLALPLNLLMFEFLGHIDFAPENKLIAEITGIIIGTVLGYMGDYYYEIENEIKRRKIVEEELQKTIHEKELLHHEIHHRVKNNLNIVKSLIQLQLNRSENKEFKNEAVKLMKRIYSIARVHEELYRGSKAVSPYLDKYIPQLVSDILTGIDEGNIKPEYRLDVSNKLLDIEKATSLGLIINEVLTNAVKYSLALVKNPELIVVIREDSGNSIIELINNAPTFIPNGDDYQGLGLKLIKTLSAQIDAEYEYIPGNGTTFRLSFPDSNPGMSESA